MGRRRRSRGGARAGRARGLLPGRGGRRILAGRGVGWLARRHGLACNSILAADVVTADGRLVRADAESEPDLFWAIRGGGGSFGAITALEIALFPVERLYAGALFLPLERAPEVLHRWAAWAPGTPDEVTSVGRMLRLPPLPELPDHLRGQSFSVVEAAFLGDEAEGAKLLRPLRELGPAMDTFATITPDRLLELHMDPPEPVPGMSDHLMFADAPPRRSTRSSRPRARGRHPAALDRASAPRRRGSATRRGRRPARDGGPLASLDGRFLCSPSGSAWTPRPGRRSSATRAPCASASRPVRPTASTSTSPSGRPTPRPPSPLSSTAACARSGAATTRTTSSARTTPIPAR